MVEKIVFDYKYNQLAKIRQVKNTYCRGRMSHANMLKLKRTWHKKSQ